MRREGSRTHRYPPRWCAALVHYPTGTASTATPTCGWAIRVYGVGVGSATSGCDAAAERQPHQGTSTWHDDPFMVACTVASSRGSLPRVAETYST